MDERQSMPVLMLSADRRSRSPGRGNQRRRIAMTPFAYAAVHDVSEAIACADEGSMFLAGGTEALNWLRLGIENPKRVVDLSRIAGLDRIEPRGDGLRLGALARLSDVCAHQIVRRDYPVLAQATEKSASAQLRNLATIGGNLLQR